MSNDTYTVRMSALQFAWDEKKNRVNARKHGVGFEEAQTVFLDERAPSASSTRIIRRTRIASSCSA